MSKRTVRQFTDNGFGFPIVLESVPMIKVRGEWTPHVNYKNLAREVLRNLVELPGRLTGNQVKFIRTYFEMTLQSFAERFDVSHPAVMKWEKGKGKPTGMTWGIEKDIRLFTAKMVDGNADEFLALYKKLEAVAETRPIKVKFSAKKLAA